MAGALGLAVVNIATLTLAGRPWGITSGFALWGSKMFAGIGVDVASWPYWQSASRAAALAGRFAPVWRIPVRSLAAAIVGGSPAAVSVLGCALISA